jgi:hypothetical protein
MSGTFTADMAMDPEKFLIEFLKGYKDRIGVTTDAEIEERVKDHTPENAAFWRYLYFRDITGVTSTGILTGKEQLLNVLKFIEIIPQTTPTSRAIILTNYLKKYGSYHLQMINKVQESVIYKEVTLDNSDMQKLTWPLENYPSDSPPPYTIHGDVGEEMGSAKFRVYEKIFPNMSFQEIYKALHTGDTTSPNENSKKTYFEKMIIDAYNREYASNSSNAAAIDPTSALHALFQEGTLVNNTIYTTESSIDRNFAPFQKNTFDEFAFYFLGFKNVAESESIRFVDRINEAFTTDTRRFKDWKQQLYFIVPTDTPSPFKTQIIFSETDLDGEHPVPLDKYATLQFYYDGFMMNKIGLSGYFDENVFSKIIQIQGYKMYEHAHFLMAVASGVKYMSPIAYELLPEFTKNDTRFTWLDDRMAEWAARIAGLPRLEKEIEQTQYNVVKRYIDEKRAAPQIVQEKQQQVNIQVKANSQINRMAENMNRIILESNFDYVDPNSVYSRFDKNFRGKYATRLADSNLYPSIAPIKPRKTGFFFGESRKAYKPRLMAQLRTLQGKLKSLINNTSATRPTNRLPEDTNTSIQRKIELLESQIREIKAMLNPSFTGGARRRHTRKYRRRATRRHFKKTSQRTRRV